MIVRVDEKDLSDLIGRAFGKVSARDMSAEDHELLARLKRTAKTGVHSTGMEDEDPGETREFSAIPVEAGPDRERPRGYPPPPEAPKETGRTGLT